MEGQLQKRSLTGKRFSGGGLGGRVRQLLGVGAVRPGRDAAPAWHALSCRSWQERPSLCPHAGRGLREPNNHAPCPLWRPQSQSCWWVSCRLLADKTEGGACQATQVSWFCHLFLTLAAPRHSTSFPEMDL